MSARERSRYITTAVVFGLAFAVIGLLVVRSARVMAQSFTWRPQAGISNTYAGGVASTQRLGFAFDPNTNTAATTYTNADFGDDGGTADTVFTWSGRWSAFQQTTTFIRNVGIYVLRASSGNQLDQWQIQYSLDGVGGTYIEIDSNQSTSDPIAKGLKGGIGIPADTDLENNLFVRTRSKQLTTAVDAILNIYDIRVEAEWNPDDGGLYPLRIDTESLPDGVKDVAYTATDIEASGGNTPYDWCLVSGAIPTNLTLRNPSSQDVPSCPSTVSGDTVTLSGTPTAGGDYTFRVKVSDDSSPAQTDQQEFTVTIAGLGIDPPGPGLSDWDPVFKNTSGSQTFTAQGGTSPYTWCLVSGTIPSGLTLRNPSSQDVPSCPSTVSGATVTLSGTPDNSGVYSFTLKLDDTNGEAPVEHSYVVEVSSTGVTILKRILRSMVKGISYGTANPGYTPMSAQQLRAVNVIYSSASSEVTWSSVGLPTGLGLQGKTLDAIANTSSVYIGGVIGVAVDSRIYNFTATIKDDPLPSPPIDDSDTENFDLKVLQRKTLLLRPPPAAATLPSDNKLLFVVFAEGGAPSNPADTALDGASVSYYNYFWLVTEVGDSPPLKDAEGNRYHVPVATERKAGPDSISIIFEDSANQPVTGTYDVTFWAQDKIARDNPPDAGGSPANHPAGTDTNDAYEFTPVTVRIKVIVPGGRTLEKDAGRPTMLRQERFR